jgi:hypothetical protein
MELKAPADLRLVLSECFTGLAVTRYVEDLADALAGQLFVGSRELEAIEARFWVPRPSRTVREAYHGFSEIDLAYRFMCARRRRSCVLGTNQQRDVFINRLPTRVAELLRQQPYFPSMGLQELYNRARELEEAIGPAPAQVFMEVEQPTPAPPVYKPCPGCAATDHLKKNCPHAKSKCAHCGEIGHISPACRSNVLPDRVGRPRIIVRPHAKGSTTKTLFDNQRPDQIKTAAQVVAKALADHNRALAKQRERYAKKKEEVGEGVMPRPRPKILTVEEAPVDYEVVFYDDADPEDEPLTLEYDLEEEPLPEEEETPEGPAALSAINLNTSKLGCLKTLMNVNGFDTEVVVDTGAECNVMTTEKADALNIHIDPGIAPSPIIGASGTSAPSPTSLPVELKLPGCESILVRFKLLTTRVPVLVSCSALAAFGVTIDPANRVLVTPTAQRVQAWTVEEPLDAKVPSLVQQEDRGSVSTAIKEALKSIPPAPDVTPEFLGSLTDLLSEFADIWHKPQAGKCSVILPEFEVLGPPKRAKARPVPPALESELFRQVDDLIAADLISPDPLCEWVAPCHLVPKPRSDKWRLVIDYRYINSVMADEGYPIPQPLSIFAQLRGSRWFSLVDLNWGFWNVRLSPQARRFTGFAVPGRGVFVWNVLPFGLKVSPTVFQRAIEIALRPVIDRKRANVYIDDIIVSSITLSDHLTYLRETFQCLRQAGFFVNFSKVKLVQLEVLLLGHIVSFNSLSPDPAKLQGLLDAQPPKDKDGVRSLTAAASFMRAYIPHLAELLEPLTSLLTKSARFVWDEVHQKAFEDLRNALIEAVSLALPDFSRPFVLFADASSVALGAVLTQVDPDTDAFHPIAFASKKLTSAERAWSTSERELYAIVWGCEHFSYYLMGTRPYVYTDHKALVWLKDSFAPKLCRWALCLMPFSPRIFHVSGASNALADWMSRSIEEEPAVLPDYAFVPEVYHLVHSAMDDYRLPTADEMAAAAKEEERALQPGTLDWYEGHAYSRIARRLFVPSPFRRTFLLWFHASRFGGHQGVRRTVLRLRRFVWWPGIQRDVEDFIRSCPICNALKPVPVRGQHSVLSKPTLFQLVSLDAVGPRYVHGVPSYLAVIIDHYSRFAVAVVLAALTSEALTEAFALHWVARFGCPRAVLTDQGSQFTGNPFRRYVTEDLRAAHHFASVQYPQGNGINESCHRIIEHAIKTHRYSGSHPFTQIVNEACLVYNITPHPWLGDTPASVVFGTDLHVPGLEELDSAATEEARLSRIREHRLGPVLLDILAEALQRTDPRPQKTRHAQPDFIPGDIATYALSESESMLMPHVLEAAKYRAVRSFPCRVIEVHQGHLLLRPLWTRGPDRRAPTAQCKRLVRFIPDLLREEAEALFPHAPWTVADDQLRPVAVPGLPSSPDKEPPPGPPGSRRSRPPVVPKRRKALQRHRSRALPSPSPTGSHLGGA